MAPVERCAFLLSQTDFLHGINVISTVPVPRHEEVSPLVVQAGRFDKNSLGAIEAFDMATRHIACQRRAEVVSD